MNIIKFLLKGLFSNKVIIEDGKKQKWWLSFVVLVVSIVLSVTPILINALNSNGSDYITSYTTRNVDYSLERLSVEYMNGNNAKVELKIQDQKMVMDETKSFANLENKKSVTLKNNETFYYVEISQDTNVTLIVGYVPYSTEDINVYENEVAKLDYARKQLVANYQTTTEVNENGYLSATVHNTLIFSTNQFRLSISEPNSTVNYKVVENVVSLEKEPSYVAFSGLYSEIDTKYQNLTNFYSSNRNQMIDRWSNFFDQAYNPLKVSTALASTAIFVSLNAFVVLAMTITLMIMSRFKTALCEKLSFGASLKYISFASLCPAILSFVVYFIMPSMQSMAFFTFLALRSIFFSTKLTRGEFLADKK